MDIEGDVAAPFPPAALGARGAGRGVGASSPAAVEAARKPVRRGGRRFRQRKTNALARPADGGEGEVDSSLAALVASEVRCDAEGGLSKSHPLVGGERARGEAQAQASQSPPRRRGHRSWSAPSTPATLIARPEYCLAAEQGVTVVVKNTFIHVAHGGTAATGLTPPWRPALLLGREVEVRLVSPLVPDTLGEASADSDASLQTLSSGKRSCPSTDWEFPVHPLVREDTFFPVAVAAWTAAVESVMAPVTSASMSVGPNTDVGEAEHSQEDADSAKLEAKGKGSKVESESDCSNGTPRPAEAGPTRRSPRDAIDSMDVLDAFDAFHGSEWRGSPPAPSDEDTVGLAISGSPSSESARSAQSQADAKVNAKSKAIERPKRPQEAVPEPEVPEHSEYQEVALGLRVRLKALKRKPEFNGKVCVVEAYDAAARRYSVRLLGSAGPELRARLMREHFELEPDGPPASTLTTAPDIVALAAAIACGGKVVSSDVTSYVAAPSPRALVDLSALDSAEPAAPKASAALPPRTRRVSAPASRPATRPASRPPSRQAAAHDLPPALLRPEPPLPLAAVALPPRAAVVSAVASAPAAVGGATRAGWRPTLRM